MADHDTAGGPLADRPRPLVTAATAQSPIAGLGALGAGGLYLIAVVQAGAQITVLHVVFAIAISMLSAAASYLALHRTVTTGEKQVTPTVDPVDPAGQPLIPADSALLDQALSELVQQHLRTTVPPKPPPPAPRPAATQAFAAAPPTGPKPTDVDIDWYGAGALTDDERRAAAARQPATTQLPPPPTTGRHTRTDPPR